MSGLAEPIERAGEIRCALGCPGDVDLLDHVKLLAKELEDLRAWNVRLRRRVEQLELRQ